jgi:hypothetical protein
MICSAKPVLTERLCVVQKGIIFNNMQICYIRILDERPSIFRRENPILSLQKMLHKDYYRKGSVGKNFLIVGLKDLDVKTN